MARKQLVKGANAAKVEERIARVPPDINGPAIFKALREVEEPKKTPAPVSKKKKPAQKTKADKAPAAPAVSAKKKSTRQKDVRFSGREKEMIVKSCIEYRNSLPVYLKSVQEDVKVIDKIVMKLQKE